ncbi:AT-hook motif nuclear-localized protein 28-like [Vicia villosa]|uniref:AT-hook motif nuclear-localized protein 28-like n=1 Tax=Vicia villosa TaxID=3911 RepID=UPI00273BFD1F|nr:AT-hook motif nuclear-localized protein 28-like [Vicia villosa]
MTTNNHRENLLMSTPSSKSPSSGAFFNGPSEQKEDLAAMPFKRCKGRPRGSKNKPKSYIEIEEEPDNIMKWVVIKIPTGDDIVQSLINVALHHRANITILGGFGLVSDVTLHNSVSQVPPLTISGSSQMVSISGTYFNTYNGVFIEPFHSSFSIFLAGDRGEVFGGTVVGKLKAAADILITATLSKKPEFYKGDTINKSIRKVEEDGLKGVNGVTDANSNHPNYQFLAPPPGFEDVKPWNHCIHTNNY